MPFSINASDIQEDGIGHRLGIYFTGQEQASITPEQLDRLENLGFSIFEVEGIVPAGLLDFVRDSNTFLLVRQERAFVVPYQLQKNESFYVQEDISLIQYYRNEIGDRVAAFGLFHYPDDKSAVSVQLLNRYAQGVSDLDEYEDLLYYRSAYPDLEQYPASFSFRSTRLSGRDLDTLPTQVIHFSPADTTLGVLEDIMTILQLSLETEQSIVLLPYSWFIKKISRFGLLEETIKAYIRDGRILFLQPKTPEEPVSVNWIVVLLVAILGSYAIHYHKNPAYQKSLFRYFAMHKFFTEDLIENRIRSTVPGIVLFFQHVLLGGLFTYIVVSFYITALGMEALFHHFPILSIFGSEAYGFFIFGLITTLLLQSVSIVWIQLINRKTRLYQVATLYCWPLQLNLVIVLIIATIYLTTSSGSWIALFSILFTAVWFFSFNIAALGIARYLKKYRIIYIIFTVGLHVLLLSLLVGAVFFYPPLNEPLRLTLSLP